MNRRSFIKALTAMIGAAAITPAMAKSLPEAIPSDWYIVLHEELPQSSEDELSYKEYERIQIPRQSDGSWGNSKEIVFTEANRNVLLSKLSITNSEGAVVCEIPLSCKLPVSFGVTPVFPVGAVYITEN